MKTAIGVLNIVAGAVMVAIGVLTIAQRGHHRRRMRRRHF